MATFKSPGINKRILSICAALALCVPLLLVAKADKGKGNKGGKSSMCQTVTADAEFLDEDTEGIRSDGYITIYGDEKYYGLEDTLVCLLKEQDHDFILSTQGKTSYERKSGIDRKVTLDFSANNQDPPFGWVLPFTVDPLIRVDEVLSDDGNYANQPKRFIMWFKVGRDNYRLVWENEGLGPIDYVFVTQTGESLSRIWTIESTEPHTARLESDHRGKRFTIDHFIMPFRIRVTERQDKGPTCL